MNAYRETWRYRKRSFVRTDEAHGIESNRAVLATGGVERHHESNDTDLVWQSCNMLEPGRRTTVEEVRNLEDGDR